MTGSVHTDERMRWMSALVGAAVPALAVSLPLGVASGQLRLPVTGDSAAPAGSSAPLDPRIATLAEHHPSRTVRVIVQFTAPLSAAQAQADAGRAHDRIIGKLPIIHGLALQMTAERARSLASNPDVHAVSLNTTVATHSLGLHPLPGNDRISSGQLQTTYDETLGVTPLWKGGMTGTGVGVAVIDTGVDGALPDFAGADGHSRVIVSAVDNPDDTTATDSYGHGTDAAGIIAGNGDNRSAADPLHVRTSEWHPTPT